MSIVEGLIERHVTVVGECWEWSGRGSHGYGVLTFRGRKGQLAHRIVYELLVGPIAPRLELDHLCCNKPCVNPDHLEPVTHAENMRRWLQSRPARSLCHLGHALSGDNVVMRRGRRECRQCERERGTRRREAKRAAA